jgi:hypothetical protein
VHAISSIEEAEEDQERHKDQEQDRQSDGDGCHAESDTAAEHTHGPRLASGLAMGKIGLVSAKAAAGVTRGEIRAADGMRIRCLNVKHGDRQKARYRADRQDIGQETVGF